MDSKSRRQFLLAAIAALPAAGAVASGPSCSICRGAVRGRYMHYTLQNGARHTVCSDCEHAAPRCVGCSAPFAPAALRRFPDESLWCRECVARSPECRLCRVPIRGVYYKLEHQSGEWCKDCWTRYAKCDLCQSPMRQPARSYPDGRRICAGCEATAVHGIGQVMAIVRVAAPAIEELMGRPFVVPPVSVVDMDGLDRAVREAGIGSQGAGTGIRELGLFRARGRRQDILILDGLPEDLAWETVAHELAHAWQHQHYPRMRDPLLVEGFAQWVAEAVCHRFHRRSGLQKLRQRPDLYGQGFRLFQALEVAGGLDMVLEALAKDRVPDSFRTIQ